MEQNILEFFDLSKPCPEQIPNCMDLRNQYIDETQKMQSTGCSRCAINAIKSRYINIICSKP